MKNIQRAVLPEIDERQKQLYIKDSLNKILSICNPVQIWLFGSGVEGKFDAMSDLDFLLVFSSLEIAKDAEKKLYRRTPEFPTAVDFLCTDEATFQKKSKLGGVMMVAFEDGRLLHPHPAANEVY